jgi:NADH:ubiquinone oxidoreductase subunit 4 (subunit M)
MSCCLITRVIEYVLKKNIYIIYSTIITYKLFHTLEILNFYLFFEAILIPVLY